ncbi:MAG: thioredoxin [Flavobacteriia bacterium]|nr:thioredoxin [Flavobacteriia bacterium]
MKKKLLLFQTILLIAISSCTIGQSTANLDAINFQAKIKETPNAQIIDVRTPKEVADGYIENAINIDFKDPDFIAKISKLDKTIPTFVYCLSGGRSAFAVAKMRELGFNIVYELNGGILKWKAANMPLTNTQSSNDNTFGMTPKQFQELINSDKIILIDYYAEWCTPCKKIKPFLDEIALEMKDKVIVIRIDIDKNPMIAETQKIESIPLLQVYKNKEITWSNIGFVEKIVILEHLK